MKSQIMRKLFAGNLLIFILVLLLQLFFQTALFENFLTGSQNKRLLKSVESVQASIANKDEDKVRTLIHDGIEQGIVIAAVDQEMNQLYGQSFDQYQRYFTVENDRKETYSIIEDYLESVPLQTIEVGDIVSIEGYLVDERNALVIPSKVMREKDGVVLGTDTFLIINNSDESKRVTDKDLAAGGSAIADASEPGIASSDDSTSANTEAGAVINQGQMDSDESEQTQQPTASTHTQDTSVSAANLDDSDLTEPNVASSSLNASDLPQGFVLQSPFDASGKDGTTVSGTYSASASHDTTILDARMLIIDGGGRNGESFPISISGLVIETTDLSGTDLVIHQGLIMDEIKRLSASNSTESANHYTVTTQLTTGKYLLYVSRLAESQITVIGAISLYSIKDINGMMNHFYVWLLLIELVLIAGAIYFFSRMISKPLVEMNGIALKIAHQDFSSKVNVTTNDEVGMLAISINEISTNLEHKIHQVNEMNDNLQQDYERQLELQKRHKQLSATFSHEMKTPLTILRGYIDSMQNGIYPKDQAEYYGIALRELDSASNLIAQMLEIARMESPYFALKKSAVDLWMLFFKVYDELKHTIDQKGMYVAFAVDDEANTLADAELLERVITNVLTNAMKYSPQGSRISIIITTALGKHTFSVENENAFIPTDELERIWQPFYRVEKSHTFTESGTGLGLMIVREILDSHGFAYGIRNTDRGVEFSFSCPAIAPLIESEGVV